MEIKQILVKDIKPYEKNPRYNDEAVKYVKESIKEFGFKVPIVLDANNVVVTGHTRLKASLELGYTEVPCIIANDLSDEQVKAFRLADNKVSEVAEWDEGLLEKELEGLLDDFDMSLFSFDIDDFSIEIEEEEIEEEQELNDETVILIRCDEEEIEEVYEKLSEEGYNCEVFTF